MPRHESVLDAIGRTPLIRLARLGAGLPAPIYLKAEFLNPGMSVKDRAALAMVLAAEESGALRPGGTIVEGTSGNTGIGLAIVAAQRGYRCVVVLPDKTSPDKVAVLRAYGAQVILTPATRPAEHPEQVRNLARGISDRTPGGWLADQYDNPANPHAHVVGTGPEIWQQTQGRITHFVAGIGTGGTISGTGTYLKKVSDGSVRVVGADPRTSVYGGGDGSPYAVEAIGHYVHPETARDVWPLSYDEAVVDRIERIEDRESIEVMHRLAREEGLLVGGSSGTAVAAALRVARDASPDDLVVVIAPDSGRGYLSRYFNEDWLLAMGFRDGDGSGRPAFADRAAAAGPALAIPQRATAAEARARLSDSAGGGDGADGLALVVLDLRDGGSESWAVGDVAGVLPFAALRGLPDDEPIAAHVQPLPQSAGVGENVAEVEERLPREQGWIPVLRDSRIVAVVARTGAPGRSGASPASAGPEKESA
ncbi:pyridoxal-phosphate dependent enzyme [Actinospica durhamensis]|uniref:Pyridoxal-phosphate dependent enzyme n=1 Tax=Actinospica durhamensis TaxID=1508375 RepID=A0A941IPQ5_9ACTN|nr:pyridoxal-phosphate dependent enzyme [Actinospica durhamensis]